MEEILLIGVPAFTIMFIAIDPIAVAPLFASLTEDADATHRRQMAIKSTLVGAIILAFFTAFGEAFLGALHISMDAFRAAGGVLLMLLALEMVFEKRTKRREATTEKAHDEPEHEDISVFPMGIPMIAGPGAITSIVLLMAGQADNALGQIIVVSALAVVLVIQLILLFMAGWLQRVLGQSITSAVTRVLGVILAAMAAQYIFDGIRGALLA